MGGSTFSAGDWSTYASTRSTMSRDKIFTASKTVDYLDPKNITVRESRDSSVNPASTPIGLFLDVTGSMGYLAEQIAKKALGITMLEIYNRKPVSDPHILIGGIGDIRSDNAPLQATQFEAGVPELTTQLEKLFLEGRGGGNDSESYDAAWWFMATRTSTDSWEKRKKKGYLFTFGDELFPYGLPSGLMNDKLGAGMQADLSAEDALEMAQRQWNVFHIVIEQGNFASRDPKKVMRSWQDKMGQHVIPLSDVDKLGEVIVSTIEVAEGRDADKVISSWAKGTDLVVAKAVSEYAKNVPTVGTASTGVVRF